LPQGGWENDETVEEAAAREAIEEAGVRGDLVVRYQKKTQTHTQKKTLLS
jgi:diphosphoinositol-polyphosphate diphosphatase